MNNVPAPIFDDAAALVSLSLNKRLISYPNLKSSVSNIKICYADYTSSRGQPSCSPSPISKEVGKILINHYKTPPICLAHITTMRDSLAYLVCPMCGSMHSGTLDHYLPKENYPIFAIFSKNLVPACKCNSKRGSTLLGPNKGERILHPYYDSCLGDRLLKAKFEDLGAVPRTTIVLAVPNTHPNFAAIQFHANEIVFKSAARSYIADLWVKFCRRPSLVVRGLARNVSNSAQLRAILDEELNTLDELHEGKNNWNSIFVAGLLDPHVINWLTAILTKPGRIHNSPLV